MHDTPVVGMHSLLACHDLGSQGSAACSAGCIAWRRQAASQTTAPHARKEQHRTLRFVSLIFWRCAAVAGSEVSGDWDLRRAGDPDFRCGSSCPCVSAWLKVSKAEVAERCSRGAARVAKFKNQQQHRWDQWQLAADCCSTPVKHFVILTDMH